MCGPTPSHCWVLEVGMSHVVRKVPCGVVLTMKEEDTMIRPGFHPCITDLNLQSFLLVQKQSEREPHATFFFLMIARSNSPQSNKQVGMAVFVNAGSNSPLPIFPPGIAFLMDSAFLGRGGGNINDLPESQSNPQQIRGPAERASLQEQHHRLPSGDECAQHCIIVGSAEETKWSLPQQMGRRPRLDSPSPEKMRCARVGSSETTQRRSKSNNVRALSVCEHLDRIDEILYAFHKLNFVFSLLLLLVPCAGRNSCAAVVLHVPARRKRINACNAGSYASVHPSREREHASSSAQRHDDNKPCSMQKCKAVRKFIEMRVIKLVKKWMNVLKWRELKNHERMLFPDTKKAFFSKEWRESQSTVNQLTVQIQELQDREQF